MKTFTKLELNAKDLMVFLFMVCVATCIYFVSGNHLLALNGVISYIFTFVPARLERLKVNNDRQRK